MYNRSSKQNGVGENTNILSVLSDSSLFNMKKKGDNPRSHKHIIWRGDTGLYLHDYFPYGGH